MVDLQTKFRRNNDSFLVTGLGDEAVMMNLENGDFLGLNPVAVDIWELLQEAVSIEMLIKNLIEKYDIDEAVCRAETIVYLQNMLKEKMIEEVLE